MTLYGVLSPNLSLRFLTFRVQTIKQTKQNNKQRKQLAMELEQVLWLSSGGGGGFSTSQFQGGYAFDHGLQISEATNNSYIQIQQAIKIIDLEFWRYVLSQLFDIHISLPITYVLPYFIFTSLKYIYIYILEKCLHC